MGVSIKSSDLMMAYRRNIFFAFTVVLLVVQDTNSEEVDTVEDQGRINGEAGYGRRKRDFPIPSRFNPRMIDTQIRDIEDTNAEIVIAADSKDAAESQDQARSNDGASRQRRSCYYDPVYGQVCTAPECTEYDYYGNCVASVGRRKREVEDTNSEEVDAVEDQGRITETLDASDVKDDAEGIDQATSNANDGASR